MTIIEVIKSHANKDGLPVFSHGQFVSATEKYGKEAFRIALALYISQVRPPFPYRRITMNEVHKKFLDLKGKKCASLWAEPVENIQKEVMEKYEDYKYPFSETGLGVVGAPHLFNLISNRFHIERRLATSSYGFRAAIEVWDKGSAKDIWKCLGPIWRGVNGKQVLVDEVYVSAFRLQTYFATQFKVAVAKTIYEMTDAKRVLDTSMGWGDRLAGFYASNAETYIGCDPNPNTFIKYMDQCKEYENLLGCEHPEITMLGGSFVSMGRKRVFVYNCGAEDLPWNTIAGINCAFTSPPYFSTERYNEGGENEDAQSWKKYNEYDKWRDEFFLPVSAKSFRTLDRDNGHLLINIMDPVINGKRYNSCDELVDHMKDNFVGQIGMRHMQRPRGRASFTPEELKEFMAKIFIENIWYFKTPGTGLDLFRENRISTLEDYFG